MPEPAIEQASALVPAADTISAPTAVSVIPLDAFIRVRMRSKAMGPGIMLNSGFEYDLPADTARAFIAGGYAIELATDAKRETR